MGAPPALELGELPLYEGGTFLKDRRKVSVFSLIFLSLRIVLSNIDIEVTTLLTMSATAPDWLEKGDNAWQLTAASLVALQSVPGLVVLYGGWVKHKWV
jgi:hypothetical protein